MDAFTSSGNYLGTDRIERPLTDAESKQLGKLLRQHGYVEARLIALRFAHTLTANRGGAQDLMGRADLRLVRWGWDPNAVPLVKRLCRLVYSEHTHQARETDAAVRAEEAFLAERKAETAHLLPDPPARGDPLRRPALPPEPLAASPEQQAIRREEEQEEDARHGRRTAELQSMLPELRALFRRRKDAVNLLWLEHRLAGTTDVATMAERSGRPVEEFYAAARRRNRAVRNILGIDAPPGAEDEEKD